jgi:hypothetical protein
VECFCGCGRKVGIRMRDVNKRGAAIDRDALLIRALLQRGLSSPAAEAFVSDAMAHCETLASAVHTGVRLDRDVETETSRFASFANARFSERALRSEVRVSQEVARGRGRRDLGRDVGPVRKRRDPGSRAS